MPINEALAQDPTKKPASDAAQSRTAIVDTISAKHAKTDTASLRLPELSRRNRQQIADPKEGEISNAEFIQIVNLAGDTIRFAADDSVQTRIYSAEILEQQKQQHNDSVILADYGKRKLYKFNPTRAVWLSALLPGLGQIYNRRYWKLPIVVGGFLGLAYATSWNNRMLTDYSQAYRDATDDDPNTRSYMDLFPPTIDEKSIDMEWLKKSLQSKRNYFRRNRDLCIFGLVAMYALCVIDAYVDASLSAFDVSEDLSMKVRPAVIQPGRICGETKPGLGLQCQVKF